MSIRRAVQERCQPARVVGPTTASWVRRVPIRSWQERLIQYCETWCAATGAAWNHGPRRRALWQAEGNTMKLDRGTLQTIRTQYALI